MADVLTKPHQLIASDRVEGTAVRRPTGDRLGHIEQLMIDKVSGRVSYAILSFGGFPRHRNRPAAAALGPSRLQPEVRSLCPLDIDDEELKRGAVISRRQGFRLGRSLAGS